MFESNFSRVASILMHNSYALITNLDSSKNCGISTNAYQILVFMDLKEKCVIIAYCTRFPRVTAIIKNSAKPTLIFAILQMDPLEN